MKKRLCFIVNPHSGNTPKKRVEQWIKKYLDLTQFDYEVIYTEWAGHATKLTQEAVKRGAAAVIAVGGDGSVNEVARGLQGSEVVLGILPLGSGNGFARHLGIVPKTAAALKIINQYRVKKIDSATINGDLFVNLVGFGFDGFISNLMKKSPVRGLFGYAIQTLPSIFKYKSSRYTIQIEEQPPFERDCYILDVANGSTFGYAFKINALAKVTDGSLEVVIIKDAPQWKYLYLLWLSVRGKIHESPIVEVFSGQKITVTAPKNALMHLDGEGAQGSGRFEIVVKQQALPVIC